MASTIVLDFEEASLQMFHTRSILQHSDIAHVAPSSSLYGYWSVPNIPHPFQFYQVDQWFVSKFCVF